MPNLAVSAAYTWRKSTDLTATQLLSGYYWYSWIGVTRADYVQGAPVTRNGFTATPFVLSAQGAATPPAARCCRTGPTTAARFSGLELAVVKRLSSHWMARAAVSYNDWTESVGAGRGAQPDATTTWTRRSTAARWSSSAPARARTTTRTPSGRST